MENQPKNPTNLGISGQNAPSPTGNVPASTLNVEAATPNVEAATPNVEAATDSVEAATDSVEAATDSVEAATDNVEPSTIGAAPATTGAAHSPTGVETATTAVAPPKKKRRWWPYVVMGGLVLVLSAATMILAPTKPKYPLSILLAGPPQLRYGLVVGPGGEPSNVVAAVSLDFVISNNLNVRCAGNVTLQPREMVPYFTKRPRKIYMLQDDNSFFDLRPNQCKKVTLSYKPGHAFAGLVENNRVMSARERKLRILLHRCGFRSVLTNELVYCSAFAYMEP